jgi:hypothetical protein
MKHFQKLLVVWHNFIGRAGEKFEYIWINGSENFIYLKFHLFEIKSVQDELREWKGKCMNLEGASHPPSL